MPTYEIKAPNGRTYQIDGPAGASDEQVRARVLEQHPDAGGTPRPKTTGTGAFARGALDTATVGFSDEIVAGLDTVFGRNSGSKTGWQDGFAGAYDHNLGIQRRLQDSDEQLHGGSRLSGQFAGGLVPVPGASLRAVGTTAARTSLRSGASRGAARIAASRAVTGRVARTGAAYGAAYGAGSAEGGLDDRALGAATGAATGYVTGRLVGRGMQAGDDYLRASRAARMANIAQRASNVAAYDTAQSLGVDAPASAFGGRGMRILDNTLSNTPFAGKVVQDGRVAAVGQMANAAGRMADRYAPARTSEPLVDAGEALQRGSRTWMTRFSDVARRAYDAVPIPANSRTNLTNTRAALDELTAGLESNPQLSELIADGRLSQFRAALTPRQTMARSSLPGGGMTSPRMVMQGGDLSWNDLKAFRTYIGEKVGQAQFGEGASAGQLRRLYGALSEDMRASAAARGPRALNAFERANRLWADGQTRIEKALVDILGKDGNRPVEQAGKVFDTITQSGLGAADIRKLRAVRSSMPQAEWNEVSGALLRRMGMPQGREQRGFSAMTFANNYNSMSREAKDLVFGGGRTELRRALDDFANLSRAMAETDRLANTSNTAGQVVSAGALYGMFGLDPTTIGANVGGYAMAKAMSNPRFVNWYVGTMRGAGQAGNRSPQAAQRFVQSRAKQLTGILGAQNEVTQAIQATIAQSANDNVGFATRAAAGGQDRTPDPRERAISVRFPGF